MIRELDGGDPLSEEWIEEKWRSWRTQLGLCLRKCSGAAYSVGWVGICLGILAG